VPPAAAAAGSSAAADPADAAAASENAKVDELSHACELLRRLHARLTEALKVAAPPVQAPPDEVKRALKRSAHDAFAFGAEALDELVAAGVDLTPLAALFLDHCNNSVPRGYRVEWRAKDGVFKRAAAESRAENQAMRAAGSEP
jgi:outer membrane murein-binding lipoprotein Lpp